MEAHGGGCCKTRTSSPAELQQSSQLFSQVSRPLNQSQTLKQTGRLSLQGPKAKVSFAKAMQDYCKYRWLAFQFLKRRLKAPLSASQINDLEEY